MKRALLVILAVIVVAGGTTVAVAAAGDDEPAHGLLEGFIDRLADDGYLTGDQADLFVSGIADLRAAASAVDWRGVLGMMGEQMEEVRDAVAGALGIDPADLEARLDAGETVASIAADRGVPLDDVIAAVVDLVAARVSEAQAGGLITDEQAARLIEGATAAVTRWFESGSVMPHRMLRGIPGAPLETVADLLGMDVDSLIADLEAGKTIAEIAEAQGVDVSGLVDDLVAAVTGDLAGRFEAWINGEHPMDFMHGDGFFGHRGPMGFGGMPEDLADLPEEMRSHLEEFFGGEIPDSLDDVLGGMEWHGEFRWHGDFEWEGEAPGGAFFFGPHGFRHPPLPLDEAPAAASDAAA